MRNYVVNGGRWIMEFILKYSIELIILFVFYIVRAVLNSKIVKNKLEIKYYVVINILLMIIALIFIWYIKKSIEFMLGGYTIFIIFDIYDFLIKRYLKKK